MVSHTPTTEFTPTTQKSSSKIWRIMLIIVIPYLLVSGYLAYTKITNQSTVCLETSVFNCDAVQTSRWSEFAGLSVAAWAFGLMSLVGITLILEKRVAFFAKYGVAIVFGLVLFGFLYHSYLTIMAATRIRALCPWCLSAHAMMLIQLILASIRLKQTYLSSNSTPNA